MPSQPKTSSPSLNRSSSVSKSSKTTKSEKKAPEKKRRGCCRSLCCRCCLLIFITIGIPTLLVLGKTTVDFLNNPPVSCVGWEGSGSCEVCDTSIGIFLSDALHGPADLGVAAKEVGVRFLKPDLKATCRKCPEGWALVKGPPEVNHVFKNSNGTEFFWHSHCAEMLHENEKQILMIRHGQSTWNAQLEKYTSAFSTLGLFIGEDAPLSKLGLYQAQRLASIIRKADTEVYGSETNDAESAELSAARSELNDAMLAEEVEIIKKETKKVVTDTEMVGNLASQANRAELDILVGRKCEDTNFVSSALTRAMDTLLIGTMQRTSRCHSPWQISSNLQEIEHNIDCEPKLQPRGIPKFVDEQHKEYSVAGINGTKKFVEAMYPKVESSRHQYVKKHFERLRLWDQSPQMIAELDATFESPKKFSVWGGHSIWFRVFFQYFADKSNKACDELASMKVANTAILSVHMRRLKNSPRKYVAYSCKFIHLGSDKEYKIGKKKKDPKKAEESVNRKEM